MEKDRGEVRADGADSRRHRQASRERSIQNDGAFALAFADALRDILKHERRRAA